MRREKLQKTLETLRAAAPVWGLLRVALRQSFRYLFTTEVHAYAFSIAANAYLSFFPLCLMLLAVCQLWLHWEGAYQTVLQLLHVHLPPGADSLIKNLSILAQGHRRLQLMSVVMLLFTSSGVFLPLEIALNKIWGFERNRGFLRNQVLSFALAVITGILSLFSILITTAVQWLLTVLFGWLPTGGLLAALSRGVLEIVAIPLAVSIYFVIYYFLPNGKVPVQRVLPAAFVVGIMIEVAKFIYILTLPLFRFREVYGPFALSVTMLFWAFVGALILLLGAHLSAQSFGEAVMGVPAPVPAPLTPSVARESARPTHSL